MIRADTRHATSGGQLTTYSDVVEYKPLLTSQSTSSPNTSLTRTKVEQVRQSTASAPPPTFAHTSRQWAIFESLTVDEVLAAIRRLSDKSSAADPFTVPVLKQLPAELAPYLTELFNRSMDLRFPTSYKSAFISPRLKKAGLNAARLLHADLSPI